MHAGSACLGREVGLGEWGSPSTLQPALRPARDVSAGCWGTRLQQLLKLTHSPATHQARVSMFLALERFQYDYLVICGLDVTGYSSGKWKEQKQQAEAGVCWGEFSPYYLQWCLGGPTRC
ncbi:hypothetical protein NDU88_007005 [Pleurodeles waltl]|uniref:Uncharacterized protein n=1 Tax=Pleurodeles waltl TaxID=8319 RepID=A0AAV7QJG9_PLEWA|nr:hypothetical protein NDU88_007005 [Pleurodeles waltl]